MVEIIEVNSKELQKELVDFQFDLYKDCPQWVPPFRSDAFLKMDKEKHPFYDHSESDFFLAIRDGKVVGRISALMNRPFNEYHNCKDGEFYLFDAIDDQEVANALFDRVFEWARARGLERIVGPKGYGPLDGYGIQIYGFEQRAMMNMMNYNYPYYQKLVENYGFTKEVDFVSSYLSPKDLVLPEKVNQAVKLAEKHGKIRIMNFRNKKEVMQWVYKIKEAYNRAFVNNWEYYPLTDRELDTVVESALQLLDPKLLKIIVNQEDEIVGFVLPFPDVSEALQKNNGKVGLIEIIRLFHAIKTTEWLDFNGIGILPEYQGMGGNAIIFNALLGAIRDNPRFIHAELTQVAETAVQMRRDLENLGVRYYKNHRVYQKLID